MAFVNPVRQAASNLASLKSRAGAANAGKASAFPAGYGESAVLALAATLFVATLLGLSVDVPLVEKAALLSPGLLDAAERATDAGLSGWTLVPTGVLVLVLLCCDWRRTDPLL